MQVYQSSGVFVGPNFEDLTEAKQRLDELYGEPPEPLSTEIDVPRRVPGTPQDNSFYGKKTLCLSRLLALPAI